MVMPTTEPPPRDDSSTLLAARAIVEHVREQLLDYEATLDPGGRRWQRMRIDNDRMLRSVSRYLEEPGS